jgi:hypothetical protein
MNGGTWFEMSRMPSGPLNYERINEIINKLELGFNGFKCVSYRGAKENEHLLKYDPKEDDERFADLVNMIEAFYIKHHGRKGQSSRTLKHVLETGALQGYISNGFCILAFAYAGFTISKYKDGKTSVVNTPDANIHAKSVAKYVTHDTFRNIMSYISKIKKGVKGLVS